jgi:hypothetical protein
LPMVISPYRESHNSVDRPSQRRRRFAHDFVHGDAPAE